MEGTAEGILSYAVQRANEVWDENRTAYLLARLSPELKQQGVDYREVIGPQSLKQFIGSASDRLRVVLHPIQRSKVGIVPAGVSFEFEDEPVEAATPGIVERDARPATRQPNGRYTVLAFLQLINELDPADMERVQIPVDILAKLAARR